MSRNYSNSQCIHLHICVCIYISLNKQHTENVAQTYFIIHFRVTAPLITVRTPPPPNPNPIIRLSEYHVRGGAVCGSACGTAGGWVDGPAWLLLPMVVDSSGSSPPSWIPDSLHHLVQPRGLTGGAGVCVRPCWALAASSVCQ